MGYDPKEGYVVLFGGYGATGNSTPYSDTWIFDNGKWSNITSTAGPPPQPRAWASLTYDTADGYLLLTQGEDCNDFDAPLCENNWAFSGGRWSELNASPAACSSFYGASTVYDSTDGYVVTVPWLLSASNYGVTCTYEHGIWTDITYNSTTNTSSYGPNYWWPALVNDPAQHGLIFYGGRAPPDISTPSNETFFFSNGTWSNLSASVGSAPPPSVPAGGAAFDPNNQVVQMFSGLTSSTSASNETWEYSGNWSELTSEVSPPASSSPSICWDPAENATLLYGGYSFQSDSSLNQTWALSQSPLILGLHLGVTPSPTDQGSAVTLAAGYTGGIGPFNISWEFGDGTVASGQSVSHVYRAAGSYVATVWVNDSAGHHATADSAVTVNPLPTASISYTYVSGTGNPCVRSNIPVTVTYQFFGNVTGGTSPFAYTWTFGDGSNVSTLKDPEHKFSPNGFETNVTLSVTDSFGHAVNTSIFLLWAYSCPPEISSASNGWLLITALIVIAGVSVGAVSFRLSRKRQRTKHE
jgi:hypothetical protein